MRRNTRYNRNTSNTLDESDHDGMIRRALYVADLPYDIDPDHVPRTPEEYICQTRRELPKDFSLPLDTKVPKSLHISNDGDESNPEDDLKLYRATTWWKQIEDFSDLRSKLFAHKELLKQKFDKTFFPEISNEKEWCSFCLGDSLTKSCSTSVSQFQHPLLSILLYLSENDIVILLKYHSIWMWEANIVHCCQWIYALLAVLPVPLSNESQLILANICNVCSDVCDKITNPSFGIYIRPCKLILGLLNNYFQVDTAL